MNETTKRFLKAIAQDPTLTEPQLLLIQIIADMGDESVDEFIARRAAEREAQATRQPLPDSSA